MASELEELTKLPLESMLFDMNFTKRMGTSEAVASVTSTAFINEGRVTGSTDITLGTASFLGNIVQLRISDGQSNEQYTIVITIYTTLGNTIIGKGLLRLE